MGFMDILLLLMALLIFAEGSINWAMENENFTLSSDCPKACRDIKIEYPFGIGNGCFYAAGFNLTCAYDSSHPKLLLGDGTIQIKNFDMEKGLIYIEPPHVTLNVDTQSINATLINLKNLSLSLDLELIYSTGAIRENNYNDLYVVGCSGTANIFDVVTTGTIDTCSTICSTINTSTAEQRFMFGNGYCSLNLYDINSNKESWDIQLTRLNENEHHMINSSISNITAIIFDGRSINYDDRKRLVNHGNTTAIMASLSWYISDYTSCKEAMNRTDTYACRSQTSECYDVLAEDSLYQNETMGYTCENMDANQLN